MEGKYYGNTRKRLLKIVQNVWRRDTYVCIKRDHVEAVKDFGHFPSIFILRKRDNHKNKLFSEA